LIFFYYIKNFYKEIKHQRYPDIGSRLSWEDGDDPEYTTGAPVIFNVFIDKFTFENFKGVTFEDVQNMDKEIGVKYMDYKGGKYKNAKKVPLPLIPRGAANTAFAVEKKGLATFVFDEITTSELKKIVRSEIELTFE